MITKQIRSLIVDTFMFGDSNGALDDADSFMGKGIIDSLGILELVTRIEENYGIKVEDEELIPENLDSIALLSNFVLRKIDQSHA